MRNASPDLTNPVSDGLWTAERRALTIGLVLTITLVAFEALAIATVMPIVKDDLGGLALYGWVFSGFFLASLLGIVVAGQLADRRGLALPFAAGLALFALGLIAGGAATSMLMLVLARLAQGFGAGAIPAVAYAAIARGYPERLRPRMFAVVSTAWVVPGLIGPALATVIEHVLSWHWVFLGLLPVVLVAGAIALPAIIALPAAPDRPLSSGRQMARPAAQPLLRVVLLVLGVGAVLLAGSVNMLIAAVLLFAIGVPVGAWAFSGLVPPGTLRLAPGLPVTIAVRGLLTAAFFSADAYVPLMIVDGRGAATWVAGVTLSVVTVTWAAGSWTQARVIDRIGPRRLDVTGFGLIAAGAITIFGVSQGLPVGLAVVGWGVAGLGMGIAHAPLSVITLAAAEPHETGAASASLQLSDTLGLTLGAGLGGWIIASGDSQGWSVADGVGAAFIASLLLAGCGLLAARRLPQRLAPNL